MKQQVPRVFRQPPRYKPTCASYCEVNIYTHIHTHIIYNYDNSLINNANMVALEGINDNIFYTVCIALYPGLTLLVHNKCVHDLGTGMLMNII